MVLATRQTGRRRTVARGDKLKYVNAVNTCRAGRRLPLRPFLPINQTTLDKQSHPEREKRTFLTAVAVVRMSYCVPNSKAHTNTREAAPIKKEAKLN